MNPYKHIAELFGVPGFGTEEWAELPSRRKEGKTSEESKDLGRQSLDEGDYEQAIKHFRSAIEQRGSEDVTSLVDLAGAYEYGEMAPQALRQYERALKAQRDADEPHVGLSQIYKRYARYRDSIEELQSAIEIQPRNAFYHFKLAEIFREIGERKKALEAMQGAIAASPEESFYHYWTGDLLIEMRQFEEALRSLQAAIELSPGDDYLYFRAAAAFWGAGKQPEAVKAIRLASDLDPDKDLYHGILRMLLLEMGLDEDAAQERERSGRMDNYDRELLRRFAKDAGSEFRSGLAS